MENIVRTVNSALLQTSQLLGLPYVVKPHTTLNEKFSIATEYTLSDTDRPTACYIAIGNGGHRMSMGAGQIPYPDMLPHRPRDMALFNHIPFVMRELNNDLTPTQRENYRLRTTVVQNGTSYYAYYLKKLNFEETTPSLEYRTVQDGTTRASPFESSVSDLSPTPQEIPTSGAVTTSGDYVAATAKVDFVMDANDIAEFLNVTNILYGNPNMGIISEIAYVAGVDRDNVRSGDITYTEVIAAQVVSFIYDFFVVKSNKTSLSISLDVGSVESMLNLQGTL